MPRTCCTLILLAVLFLGGCAANSSNRIEDDPNYENDFFGLAILAADHDSSFDILGYGPNGVKYEFNKSKMDRRLIAYGRIDVQKKPRVLWLGIKNNEAEALDFNRKEDSLTLEFTDGQKVELSGKALQYIDGAKRLKAGEVQQMKVNMTDFYANYGPADFETIILNIASNFPEIIVFKRLPDKSEETQQLDLQELTD